MNNARHTARNADRSVRLAMTCSEIASSVASRIATGDLLPAEEARKVLREDIRTTAW